MPVQRLARLVGVTGVLVTTTVFAGGQAQKPAVEMPQLLAATIVTVKPGMGPQYTELQMKEVMPAQQKGGLRARQAWSSGVFGQPGKFAFFAPVATLAQYDDQSPMVKALGTEGAAALMQKTTALIQGSQTMLIRTRPDLSYRPDPKAPLGDLMLISEVQVASGRRGDFEALLKKEVLPIMQQAKVRAYVVNEVIYGAPAGTYFSGIGYDTYAAMDKGHPFQIVLGEEGARRLEAKTAGIVTRLERFVMRYRQDLTFSAPTSTP